ncbi:MAG: hypothetical protein QOH72_4863 [Solirubrobacteraceae bacterium]|jgi:hypothetical protein|nr:hypothetical protein [Solirubrobacteraceae bacterium]
MDAAHAARLSALTAFGALPASALANDPDDARIVDKHRQAMTTAREVARDPIGELTRLLGSPPS